MHVAGAAGLKWGECRRGWTAPLPCDFARRSGPRRGHRWDGFSWGRGLFMVRPQRRGEEGGVFLSLYGELHPHKVKCGAQRGFLLYLPPSRWAASGHLGLLVWWPLRGRGGEGTRMGTAGLLHLCMGRWSALPAVP